MENFQPSPKKNYFPFPQTSFSIRNQNQVRRCFHDCNTNKGHTKVYSNSSLRTGNTSIGSNFNALFPKEEANRSSESCASISASAPWSENEGKSEVESASDPSSSSIIGKLIQSWSKYVVFLVGPDKEKMFGLKSQMIAKSQAFSEIVYSRKEVEHPEYSPASFGIFLKYINSDNLCFAESHVCDLLRLAFVYEIPHIMNKCREFAMATLSLENCLKYHLAAVLYELEDLRSVAFKFMCRQGPAFLHHPSFVELDAITLGSIISRDDFHVSEVELFLRLLEWVEAECNRLHYPTDKKEFHRRVCGNLFNHVRFAMMVPKDFVSVIVPKGILNQSDVDAILLRHATPWQLWHTLPKTRYVERPRVVQQHISVPLYKHVQFSNRRIHCPNAHERLRFITTQDIYFMGIEFFGPFFNGPLSTFKVKYHVENEFMTKYYRTPAETMSLVAAHDYELEFPHPIMISGQFPYKLSVWVEGPICQYALFPVPQAVVMLNSGTVCIHMSDNRKETWGSNVNMAQHQTPGIIKSLLFQTVDR